MDFEDDIDDLDEILSNLPSEDVADKADDSADELLDMLMVSPQTKTKTNAKNEQISENESSEDEDDEENSEQKQAEIAALEAKLVLLRSQKTKKKKKSKSNLDDSIKIEENKVKVDPNSSTEEVLCSHKIAEKKLSDCFFCDSQSSETPIVASTPCKIEEDQEPSKPKKTTKKEINNDSTTNSGFYSKKERIAHVPKKSSPPKPVEKEQTKTTNIKRTERKDSSGSYEFIGISIRNPLISSAVLDERMKGRRLIKISKIETKMKNYDIEGDWVTVGVLVDKMPQKTTSNGKNFSVWKLSDLGVGTENVLMAFFLFGEVNKEHWKTQTGAVIALLNPSITRRKEDDSISISIDNSKKLMDIGSSKDLATCKGIRKSDGRSCTMFINRQFGDYCEFHVQKAFKKAKAGRMELQSGGSKGPRNGGNTKNAKGHLMNGIKKSIDCGEVHYGGQTLSLTEKKRNNNVKLQKASGGAGAGGLRSVMSSDVKALAERDFQETKLKREKEKLELLGGTEEFKELLNVPTVGARNLHKLLKGDQIKEEEVVAPKPKLNSARSFLRNTKQELLQTNPKINRNSPSNNNNDSSQKKRKLCDVNFFDDSSALDKGDKLKKGANNKVKNHSPVDGDKPELKNKENNVQEPVRKKEKINLNKLIQDKNKVPMLGRGLRSTKVDFEEDFLCYDKYTGEDTSVSQISYGNDKGLTDTLEKKKSKQQQQQQNGPTLKPTKAKLEAIKKVQSKGGIHGDKEKSKQQTSERIKTRIENSLNKSSEDTEGKHNGEEDEVPKKKRKKGLLDNLFGEIDPNSEEGIKLHKAKSKNAGAVRLAEAEREDKYFASLEKKEAMEQKMVNTMEMKVRLYACKVCNYKAESLSKKCLDEKHAHVKLADRMKRFFACKACKQRAVAYDRPMPKNPCSKCGGSSFERTSMVNERKGPKLGAETLELRGREQKFANSLA